MLALIALGFLGMLVFGVKNIAVGKHELFKIAVGVVPVAIFGISYLTLENVTDAGIMTMMIMMGLLAVLIVGTGVKSSLKF